MDSIEVTIQRTGAATAVAAKYLARPDSRVCTVCGCGAQGRVQLRALRHALPIERALAWSRQEQRARLLQIAEKCPVHRILTGGVAVRSELAAAS